MAFFEFFQNLQGCRGADAFRTCQDHLFAGLPVADAAGCLDFDFIFDDRFHRRDFGTTSDTPPCLY